MRILIAVDTVVTTELLMNAFAARPWPRGAVARVISVVEDEAVPQELWRAAAFQPEAVRLEMRRRGEQISALTVEPLRWLGVEAEVTVLRGDPQWLIPFEARRWGADYLVVGDGEDWRTPDLLDLGWTVVLRPAGPLRNEVLRAPWA